MRKMKATLILENGMLFTGRSIGSTEERVCEMVFNTSMTGYQEILTDGGAISAARAPWTTI